MANTKTGPLNELIRRETRGTAKERVLKATAKLLRQVTRPMTCPNPNSDGESQTERSIDGEPVSNPRVRSRWGRVYQSLFRAVKRIDSHKQQRYYTSVVGIPL